MNDYQIISIAPNGKAEWLPEYVGLTSREADAAIDELDLNNPNGHYKIVKIGVI